MNPDVAILGGGLAGSLIARQLVRQAPQLKIAVFEKSSERSYKVGESSVELASHYLIRRLGLSTYLYGRQLPKNGLRFFFDRAERDGELEQLSEIGSVALPYTPAFQIDRARMEADLIEMNAQAGVDVLTGAKVSRITLAKDEEPHQFTVERDGERSAVSCRWLIDATGRAGLIAKSQKLRRTVDHRLGAVWGRFRGVADIDSLGSAAFKQRVKHTSRHLSTNHFCYPGYWIWFIPLPNGLTSVGVVMDSERWCDTLREESRFCAFLREHRAVAQLLGDAQAVDVMSYGQLSFATERYFSPQRWGLVGDAASFTDPLYSPGSDFIALENDFLCDLITRDAAGEAASAVAERCELYDAFMKFRFETTMLVYENLYAMLGSYELFQLKWDFDIACYYNLWLEPFMRDQHLDASYLRGQLRQRKLVRGVLESFAKLFRRVEAHLRNDGNYYRRNLGAFTGEFPTMECARHLGSDESARSSLERTAEAFNHTRFGALELLDNEKRSATKPLSMTHFLAGKPLA